MVNSLNDEIITLLADLGVPVAFLHYKGTETTYIIYSQTDADSSLSGDDAMDGYFLYYDFDIYSKSNYFQIVEDIRGILEGSGWIYQPARVSPDLYEHDTGFFHKTLCFKKPVQRTE